VIHLRYNHATNVVRFDFPPEWDGSAITDLKLQIADKDGTELLAAASATIYTATSLDGDVAAYLSSIVLDSAAGALVPGDQLLVAGVLGDELVRVKDYDGTTYTAELEETLLYAHADNAPVYGMWGTKTVDTTTVATWPIGKIVVLTWTPTGTGLPTTQLGQVVVSRPELEGLRGVFADVWPRAYNAFKEPTEKFDRMYDQAGKQLATELLAEGMDIERIKDTELLEPIMMTKMAWLWALNGDEQLEDERKIIALEYAAQKALIKNLPIWIDHDQDGVEDDGETTSHEPIFDRSW
jgi:hypothetical protein